MCQRLCTRYDTTNQEHRQEIHDRFGKHFDEALALSRDLTELQILEYIGQRFVQDSINKAAFEYRLQEMEREREAHRHRTQLLISGLSAAAAAASALAAIALVISAALQL